MRYRSEIRTNEVRVIDTDANLSPTYEALEWLVRRGLSPETDFDVNMHGGQWGYTSFFFVDHRIAIEFKLIVS